MANSKILRFKKYYRQFKILTIRNGWKKAEYIKKHNLFHHIGEHCFYCSNLLPSEPELVCLHNNVVISAGVRLVTHSALYAVFNGDDKTDDYVCKHGKIEIKDNVYVGADVIINYGVTINENCIIAAGAVVTKDVPAGSVVGGIPARVIGSYDEVKKRNLEESKKIKGTPYIDLVNFDIDSEK